MSASLGNGAAPRAHLQALTGVRFFAAAWVVVLHLRPQLSAIWTIPEHVDRLISAGYLGVDVFFVLSGFIISYTYAARMVDPTFADVRRFLGLRLARIYPVHVFTLFVLLAVVVLARLVGKDIDREFSAVDFLRHLFLVYTWKPSPGIDLSWNYPAWSISSEWAAYLAFPLLLVVLRRLRSLPALVVLVVVLLAGHEWLTQMGIQHPLLKIGVEFTVGMALHGVWERLRPGRVWDAVAAAAALGMVATVILVPDLRNVLVEVLSAVLVLSLALATGSARDLMSRPTLVFLGEASYSLYMTHAIVLIVGGRVKPIAAFADQGPLVQLVVVLGYAVLLMGAAIGTYLLVERPSRDWWRTHLVRGVRRAPVVP